MGVLIFFLDLKYFFLHLADPTFQFLHLIFLFLHLGIHAFIQIDPIFFFFAVGADNLFHFFIQGKDLFFHFLILFNNFFSVKLFDGGLLLGWLEIYAIIGIDNFIGWFLAGGGDRFKIFGMCNVELAIWIAHRCCILLFNNKISYSFDLILCYFQ